MPEPRQRRQLENLLTTLYSEKDLVAKLLRIESMF